ncbi:MAG: precorrin-4 C(11)-methyltransferase [Desulfovibrionales bacterium]|nr:precorrin-4 C(11)-methyltransferase [Desulfovibrionales bacterium]
MNKSPHVWFVGAGPGDPGLITVRGQECIRQADLVLYAGSLVPREVVACAKSGALVLDSAGMSLEETHALVLETVQRGGTVARVHTGDPSLYGTIREQGALLERDGVAWAIVPGVTAAFAAAARAKVSFTVPESTQSLVLTRLAGRTPVPRSESLRHFAAHGSSVAVYLSADKTTLLAEELRQAGLPADTVIVVGHKVGHPGEQILRTSLADLEQRVREFDIDRQAVFLILPGESAPETMSRLYAASFGHGFRRAIRPDTWTRLAVYALTAQGLALARRMVSAWPGDIFVPRRLADSDTVAFARLSEQVRANFGAYHAHVFVAAAGIVVRTIAPLLQDKTADPAVIVCDHAGQHVISLLSGHLGGANDLARRIAKHLGGQAVITTATDTCASPAMDVLAREKGCTIADPSRIKAVNSALAEGLPVMVHDPEQYLGISDHPAFNLVSDPETAQVVVTWQNRPHQGLVLHPMCLVAGIGCRRGVHREDILAALDQVFAAHHLAPQSLRSLVSVDLKKDESGLLQTGRDIGVPLEFLDRSCLERIQVPNPSNTVLKQIGVSSVCEAAALMVARKNNPSAKLIVPKTIVGPVTVAVAV